MSVSALTHVGALLADRTRASVLTVLMDGRARTGGELAGLVGVSPSTVSAHLSRLQDAGYVSVDAQGRHRYFSLAGPHVAELLERLGAQEVPTAPVATKTTAPHELLNARSCYDHLAGRLGVRIYDSLLGRDALERVDHDHVRLTPHGTDLVTDLGVDVTGLLAGRRPLVRSCLDWTERRHHLAGGVGAGLFTAFLTRGWVARGGRPRSIRITGTGQAALAAAFPLRPPDHGARVPPPGSRTRG